MAGAGFALDFGMGTDASISRELRGLIDAALRGELSRDEAQRAVEMGAEAAVAVMLAITRRIAELTGATQRPESGGPHTPSSAVPPYAKPSASKRRRKRVGAQKGHEGHRRPTAQQPDRRERLDELKTCPECHGPVKRARRWRTRVIEDMPEDTSVEAVEYAIPRHWCPCCGKHVEPNVNAALPGATIGNRLAAMTVVFHYGLGLTIDQTRQILLSPLRTTISAGGLVNLWQRLAEVLTPWYEQIASEAKTSATLHADETGWRVDGRTHWLWCFCNHTCSYYMIDRSRGSPALRKFFTDAFRGILIHDFWRPYESVLLEGDGDHQCCLAHLLRELDHVDEHVLPRKSPGDAACWSAFVKKLRRLLRDGIRLRRLKDFTPQRYGSRIVRIDRRLTALAHGAYADADATRLAKRLVRHQDQLFTFLDVPEASWENNRAEREIRPAVILRKNSQCNRSERGATTQAVLMSIYRTLKLRGLDARQTIADALTAYATTGTLPPLPPAVADG
jgi:transposase